MCCTKLIIGLSVIYAIINQVDSISEIHDNNNKSFNVLSANSVSGIMMRIVFFQTNLYCINHFQIDLVHQQQLKIQFHSAIL